MAKGDAPRTRAPPGMPERIVDVDKVYAVAHFLASDRWKKIVKWAKIAGVLVTLSVLAHFGLRAWEIAIAREHRDAAVETNKRATETRRDLGALKAFIYKELGGK